MHVYMMYATLVLLFNKSKGSGREGQNYFLLMEQNAQIKCTKIPARHTFPVLCHLLWDHYSPHQSSITFWWTHSVSCEHIDVPNLNNNFRRFLTAFLFVWSSEISQTPCLLFVWHNDTVKKDWYQGPPDNCAGGSFQSRTSTLPYLSTFELSDSQVVI